MEQSVIKIILKIFIWTCLFIFINASSQEVTTNMPIFTKKNPKNGMSIDIRTFITDYHSWDIKKLGCQMLSGSFQFKVDKEGKIKDLKVSGNLPDTLIKMIKIRIKDSECCWTPVRIDNETVDSKWFILPVFIEAYFTKDCKGSNAMDESITLIWKLFNSPSINDKFIINTPNAYLLAPLNLGGQYN